MTSNYKVERLLGEGSFGKAFLCTNQSTNITCVIKQIVIEGMSQKEQQDVINEATILGKLDHPNIIKLFEAFESKVPKHTLNIVTEYADGGDLSEKIKSQNNKPFTESDILDYFTQICLALKHIHEKKIIHRDLKSGNVFLMQSGLVKLGDFGIAKNFQNTMDKAKTMVGTPYYLSPEILENKPYDAKSDIWSLGVLLYEMMTFKMPFNANSLPMLSVKIMRGNYPPPPAVYTKDLREIVSKCLTVIPSRRPSIQEILRMPIIQNRIRNFLDEIQYNKEFSKTIAKKYKENKKNQVVKTKDNAISGLSTDESSAPSVISGNSIKITNINKNSDKNKQILDYFKQKKSKKEEKEKEKDKKKQGFKDFLAEAKKSKKWGGIDQKQFNESGVMWGKNQDNQKPSALNMYKEVEESKESKPNDLNALIESYDVDKITEEQYDKVRFLNDLNKEIDPEKDNKKDSDNEDNNDKKVIKNNGSKLIMDEGVEDNTPAGKNRTIKEVDSDNDEDYSSEFKEIELMRIDLEKILGLNLFKAAYHYVDNETDKKIQCDKEKVKEKIKNDFGNKGFSEKEIESAIQRIPDILAIVSRERIIEQ
jgi:NIMA (never in mitosis gene a)-related kinase